MQSLGERERLVLRVAFALSGAAALVYQVVWKRALYRALGVETDAVAIVVASFMIGMGTGAWMAGQFSRRGTRVSLAAFVTSELVLGTIGITSTFSFAALDTATRGSALHYPIMLAAVVLPCTLMGATLPLIVQAGAHADGFAKDLDELYAINTVGGAVGALLAGAVLLAWLGESKLLLLAGALNFIVALCGFVAYRAFRVVKA